MKCKLNIYTPKSLGDNAEGTQDNPVLWKAAFKYFVVISTQGESDSVGRRNPLTMEGRESITDSPYRQGMSCLGGRQAHPTSQGLPQGFDMTVFIFY